MFQEKYFFFFDKKLGINNLCFRPFIIRQAAPHGWVGQGKPKWRGMISTVDLPVLTSLDQLLFILKILLTLLKNNLPW